MGATLLILAAGLASRYGSLKQIEQVGPSGETILEYSIYDAINAGFNKIVFVIRPEIEREFNDIFIHKLKKFVEVDYVFQTVNMVPEGILVPADRTKPWGTSHAVLVAENNIKTPFAVINADDYYGVTAFQQMYGFLSKLESTETNYAMVGYDLQNTLSDFGAVSRGICEIDGLSHLYDIKECSRISKSEQGVYYQDERNEIGFLDPKSLVSMNFWGFTPSFFNQIKSIFKSFVTKNYNNPKAEIYLPLVLDELIKSKQSTVSVIHSKEKWFGVTYKEDKPEVVAKIEALVELGIYPENLWKN